MKTDPPPDDLATDLMEFVDDDSDVLRFDEHGKVLVDRTIDSPTRAEPSAPAPSK